MGEYRTSGHAVWDIKYHLIWITKYRYKILRGEVAERARDVIRQICQSREVTIVRGAVSPDHIHLLVSAPALLAPAKLVQYVKGKSSRRLQEDFPHLVGTGVFLRDGGRGGREDDHGVHRESEMGRGCGELQNHSADRALSRLRAGSTSGGFSRNPRLSVAQQPTGFQPVVV
jgi:putative transposase